MSISNLVVTNAARIIVSPLKVVDNEYMRNIVVEMRDGSEFTLCACGDATLVFEAQKAKG